MGEAELFDLQTKLAAATDAVLLAQERALAGLISLEVMHEVRNYVEAIGHFVYLACHNAEKPDQVREFLAAAEQQLEGLGQLSRQSLGFSRRSGEIAESDLVSLADTAILAHHHKLEKKKIHVVREHPKRVVATVHSAAMLQVIANLIANSIEALPEAGTMWLRIRKGSRCISLVVADNGRGIATEVRDKIFQPFFTTNPVTGTGLGLTLSKKIVERHGGSIRVRSSVREGRSGTIFRICLPAQPA
jgi:signal transduction histidine kinase